MYSFHAFMKLAAAVPLLVMAGCATSSPKGRTTLGDPSISFEVMQGPATIEWGDGAARLKAVLVNNQATPPSHNEGYNGLAELRIGDGASPFVPAYAGLNLEHILNGTASSDKAIQFEPRRHPMELRRIDASTYELYQAPLPHSGVESCARFEFKTPNAIDVTFECIPRKDDFPFGFLDIFWASYIAYPRDNAIYFMGRRKGDAKERWIKAVSDKHGENATHRSALDKREPDYERPFPLTLVFNESQYEYTRPFYYGRYEKNAWALMFDKQSMVRFAQSPTGGGSGNPAWDFHWMIDKPRKDQLYTFSYRAVYKPWVSQTDVLEEYENYRKGR